MELRRKSLRGSTLIMATIYIIERVIVGLDHDHAQK